MIRLLKSVLPIFVMLAIPLVVWAQEPLKVYFFYSATCPHCKKESAFLDTLQSKYSIQVERYEVTTSSKNAQLYAETAKSLNATVSSVPFLVVGDKYIVGYLNDETTGSQIEDLISSELNNSQNDIVKPIKESLHVEAEKDTTSEKNFILNFPILGVINTKDFSLPVITFFIALLDGFNPCAMWVLVFLISMLIGMGNKRKMWILGSTFILASGFVYFLFLSAWLNFFLFIGYSTLIRLGIGFLALGIGIYYLRDYYKNRGVCTVTKGEQRQKVFEKIKNIVQEKSLVISLAGIILLAFAVNIVELVCSAGLPAVYTQILAMNELNSWQYYLYLLEYIVIFMIDDIVVFILAMITFEVSGIGGKYAKYSHFIGGLVMFAIGVLMLLKPEILMFG